MSYGVPLPKLLYLRPQDLVAERFNALPPGSECVIDARALTFISPMGFVWLAATQQNLIARGCTVAIENVSAELQGFCDLMGLLKAKDEATAGNDKVGFVSMRRVSAVTNTSQLAESLAKTACPTAPIESIQTLIHCLGEATDNTKQHSGTDGFVSSMHYPSKRRTMIAVADSGIGLRAHLSQNPNLKVTDDVEAVRLALQKDTTGHPYSTGPYDQVSNTGNGLFYIDRICRECRGRMVLWSGTGCGTLLSDNWEFQKRPYFKGVLLVFEVYEGCLLEYGDAMNRVFNAYMADDSAATHA